MAEEAFFFTDDMTDADVEMKKRLKPVIDQATSEKKKWKFRAGKLFIDGKLYKGPIPELAEDSNQQASTSSFAATTDDHSYPVHEQHTGGTHRGVSQIPRRDVSNGSTGKIEPHCEISPCSRQDAVTHSTSIHQDVLGPDCEVTHPKVVTHL